MRIDRNNYELYVLDYLEGRMDPEKAMLMKQFLMNHPDIAEEVESYDNAENLPASLSSIPKTKLYRTFANIRSITPENFEEFCVAHIEGDLDKRSEKLLKSYLEDNPDKKPIFNLYKNLKYTPDRTIRFPNKQGLKKQVVFPIRRVVVISTAAAATIAFLLLFFRPGENKPTYSFSQENEKQDASAPDYTHKAADITGNHDANKAVVAYHRLRSSISQPVVIDSGIHRPEERVLLATLDPPIENTPDAESLNTTDSSQNPEPIRPEINDVNSGVSSDNQLKKKSESAKRDNKKLLWGALNVSIKGINKLTENNLALHTEQTTDGKLSEIEIESDKFGISRKINRNKQN